MRICVMVRGFPKLSETFILNHVAGILDRDHEVQIVAGTDPGEHIVHDSIVDYHLNDRTHNCDIPSATTDQIRQSVNLLFRRAPYNPITFSRLLRASDGLEEFGECIHYIIPFLNNDFDIVHAHFGPVGAIAGKLKSAGVFNAPLVVSFHGTGIHNVGEKGNDKYEEMFEIADVLLANSQWTYNNLVSFGAPTEKMKILSICVDSQKFTYMKPDQDQSSHTILSVGRLAPEKGHKDAIHAIEKLANLMDNTISYRIVGEGPLREELENQVDQADLNDFVSLCGAKSQSGVRSELRKADIFLHPSHNEAFGKTLLEAQSVGLPIVATNVGGIPDAVIPGESAYLVNKGEPAALASALYELLINPDIRIEMAEAGRQNVVDNFDSSTINDRLMEIYQSSPLGKETFDGGDCD
jgi:colanic acid/amylovoran biosynthesis glycosyltransferase